MPADHLKRLFDSYFDVEVMISNDRMYQVSGVKRQDSQKSQADTTMEEMLAMMQFMVSHNDAHAQELVELAQQLKDAGKDRAYRKLMDAVADFDVVNASLASLQNELKSERY